MDNKKTLARVALAGLLSASVMATSTSALAGSTGDMEKCYGIAKAKKNDCGAPTHACSGQSTSDGDPSSWLYVPKGLCERIVGGNLTPGDASMPEDDSMMPEDDSMMDDDSSMMDDNDK